MGKTESFLFYLTYSFKLSVCKRAKNWVFLNWSTAHNSNERATLIAKLQSTIIHVTKTLIIILGHWNRKKLENLHLLCSFQAFSCKHADPFVFVLRRLREFSFIFRCKVCSTAGGHVKTSKYCLGYILKGQKVLNDGMKLENNKATSSWKFSTQEGLALVAALSTRWWITK